MDEIITYRIKDKKTGQYLQRSGSFGKLPRNYAALNHLTLSILECYEYLCGNNRELMIEEVKTIATEVMTVKEYYEEAITRRELKNEKEKQAEKIRRKKQLLEELEELENE